MAVNAFEARRRQDRHQLRFIESQEDASDLQDLRDFTRELMTQVEKDLGTQLDWVAADHWDTDNPHAHIVLQGKDEYGRDLIIAREYLSHGMRARAAERAMQRLGPRRNGGPAWTSRSNEASSMGRSTCERTQPWQDMERSERSSSVDCRR